MRTEPRGQWCPVPQPEATGTHWNTRGSFWTPGNTFSLWWWPRTGEVAQGGCGTSSLDTFKSFLDMVLGSTWPCLSREVGHDALQRSFQTQPSCDSVNLSSDDLDGLPSFQNPSVWYADLTMLLNNLPVSIAEQNRTAHYMKQRTSNAESLSKSVDLTSLMHFFFSSYKISQSLFYIFWLSLPKLLGALICTKHSRFLSQPTFPKTPGNITCYSD